MPDKIVSPSDSNRPVLLWLRQDLRLADNPALNAALATGRPVLPLFVLHGASDGRPWGGASLWWLNRSLAALEADLRARGSRLILRRGDPAIVVPSLAQQTGAAEVCWNRLYGPVSIERDSDLKAEFARGGVKATSHNAALLAEPWTVKTGSGAPFQMFTPFWRAAQATLAPADPRPAPPYIPAPADWPHSDRLEDWRLHPRAPDWSIGFSDWTPGEAGAHAALAAFGASALRDYARARDRPDMAGTSLLSPHLHWGEVGPGQVRVALQQTPGPQVDKVMAEIGWREFNHHLLFHHRDLARTNLRREFDAFPWRCDPEGLAAWREGRTGYPLVDAGMRQLWATGFMHNRVRMVAASFLIKHLLIDWREGEAWFWDTLVDADEASNPGNWQWSAGSGADAAPFFRVFNPLLQGERFDPNGDYVRRWVPELAHLPADRIHRPWLSGVSAYPPPIVDHAFARQRALDAFQAMRRADPAIDDGALRA
jgi:deoxyribodipyrimidine photo-lyase